MDDTGKIVKKVAEYRTINMIFKQFKDAGNKKTVIMEIYETDDKDNIYTCVKEKINLKSYIYN